MKVLIGTTNPGKIQGAKEALEVFFKEIEITGVKVPSNVADQPVNEDTYNGARNRVDNLIEYAKQNNILVGPGRGSAARPGRTSPTPEAPDRQSPGQPGCRPGRSRRPRCFPRR